MTICKYVGVVFTGHEAHPTPVLTTAGNEGLFDNNAEASNNAKREVSENKRFNADRHYY